MRCSECGNSMTSAQANYEVKGYEKQRKGGGTNHLQARRQTGRVLCDLCVSREKSGLNPGQTGMLGCLLIILLAMGLAGGADNARADAPNVLVVMTDDQPYGSQAKMPFLQSVKGEYTDFTQAHNNNALCCPARATFLTGLYSHHTGVEVLNGGDFDDSMTLATEFDAAGYETGLFGKYLNEYPFGQGNGYIPEGWDRWAAFTGGEDAGAAYYDYKLNVDGTVENHGDAPADYSTDVLAGKVRDFIGSADDPFFAVYTPYGPHADYIPAARHQGSFAADKVPLPPNFNKRDAHTQTWWKDLPLVSESKAREVARAQYETLQSEDEALESFYAELAASGELDNTIIIYTTDNGYSLGSHRRIGKRCAWEECEHIPLMIRAPQAQVASTGALVSNVDLAATITDLAGVDFPEGDGTSLEPLMTGEATTLGRPALLRSVRDSNTDHSKPDPPTLWGLRTDRYKLQRWTQSGEVDLYDLNADPYELNDLAGRKKYQGVVQTLTTQMEALR